MLYCTHVNSLKNMEVQALKQEVILLNLSEDLYLHVYAELGIDATDSVRLGVVRDGCDYYFFVNDHLFATETSLRGLSGENVVGGCLVFNMGIRVRNYNVINVESQVHDKLHELGIE